MIFLEGTDAVGKTLTIEELKKEGILCNDRNKEIISKYMVFDYSIEQRAQIYYEYLKNTDCMILFLINNDAEELKRRVLSRKEIGEFDLQASLYNELYKETYEYMKERDMLENKLFLVDVTHLNLKEQVQKVKEAIQDAKYCRTYGSSQVNKRILKHQKQ